MSQTLLLACLRSYARPADAEIWIEAEPASPVHIPDDYRRAVDDLLIGLGLINPQTRAFNSVNAYNFAQSLAYTLAESALTPGHWQGRFSDAKQGAGIRLTSFLESHRMAQVAKPKPVRRVRAVLAIIKAQHAGQDMYLMQWDEKAGHYQPIGGKQDPEDNGDDLATLTRELCEELGFAISGLRPGRDFKADLVQQGVSDLEISHSLHVITQYHHTFFHLRDITFPLRTDKDTRWISSEEIEASQADDGRNISSLLLDRMRTFLPKLAHSIKQSV
jgi:8-oxo-dGTP pyrophosphatase MutT (NUDIX family)